MAQLLMNGQERSVSALPLGEVHVLHAQAHPRRLTRPKFSPIHTHQRKDHGCQG